MNQETFQSSNSPVAGRRRPSSDRTSEPAGRQSRSRRPEIIDKENEVNSLRAEEERLRRSIESQKTSNERKRMEVQELERQIAELENTKDNFSLTTRKREITKDAYTEQMMFSHKINKETEETKNEIRQLKENVVWNEKMEEKKGLLDKLLILERENKMLELQNDDALKIMCGVPKNPENNSLSK